MSQNNGLSSVFMFVFFLCCFNPKSSSAQRSTYIIHMDKSHMPKAYVNTHHWYSASLYSVDSGAHQYPPSLLYSYQYTLHGFSAVLSEAELESLKQSPGFVSAYTDSLLELDTTHTFEFLSLNTVRGIWPATGFGKGVIVGVIDSGVWPESASFSDLGQTTRVPARWKGECEVGQEFNASMCNSKLIGARYFNKGILAANPDANLTMNSARDTTGHGTHTSSTAAGNYVKDTSFFGYASGTARGIAPRAMIAVYKVNWEIGTAASDYLAAMDKAVADGVDIISISLGRSSNSLYEDPIAIASFGAMQNGVLVSASAGNRGPELGSLHNGAPWLLTSAAGSIDRSFGGALTLGNGVALTGWSMFPANAVVEDMPLVYNTSFSACDLSLAEVPYDVIICDPFSSTSLSVQLDFVSRSSVAAAIFLSDDVFDTAFFSYPGVVISTQHARTVISYAENSANPTATIRFLQTYVGVKPAPAVSSYTSRGPAVNNPGILKPDIMAPGTLVLAAYIPNTVTSFIGPNSNYIRLTSNFNMISGTSMACPHSSAIAALLKGAHPDWSPAAIKSAMMTTASPLDNTQSPIKDQGNALEIANPLAMGSGQVDPNSALNPGLVYDTSRQDYVNFICSMNFTPNQTMTIIQSSYDCSNASSDLNYPSFIALYGFSTSGVAVRNFNRVVTNMGDAATYTAKLTAPKGSVVTVRPQKMVFTKMYEKQSYVLRIRYFVNDSSVTFGSIVWTDNSGKYNVRSPIAVLRWGS